LSQGEPDIRQQVEANRGAIKKLQLLIPGLRGYRNKEDLRVSDELLRNQVADKLDRAKANMQLLRSRMAMNNDLTNITTVGSLMAQLQTLSGEVRHAAQGYAGWVAPIRIDENKLNALYEYDFAFVNQVFQLDEATNPHNLNYDSSALGSIQNPLAQFSKTVSDLSQKWSRRIDMIEGIALS
jgi:hypothetical protein